MTGITGGVNLPTQRTITSVKLTDLFGGTDCECVGSPLEAAIADGYVRRQVHPTLPLAILNYTEKAAYERVWDDVTRTCRGLIYDTQTGEIMARPLPKFWNTTEAETGSLILDEPAVVMDKLDGSLAITYPAPDGWAIATRGSFASEQALHATAVLRSRYAEWAPPVGVTVLLEILYPQNKIVVDYGDTDDLVLLGAVDIATGQTFGPDAIPDWPGPRAEVFPYRTLADALAAPVRDNAEGFVIWFPERDVRTKLKYERYVELHKIVTGLTARVVWQHIVDGKPLADLIAPLPDEFHAWVRDVADGIANTTASELNRLTALFWKLTEQMPEGWDPTDRAGRKDFAMVAAQSPDRWAMFNLLDGKDIRPELLKRAKPEPYLTPSGRTYGEDVA